MAICGHLTRSRPLGHHPLDASPESLALLSAQVLHREDENGNVPSLRVFPQLMDDVDGDMSIGRFLSADPKAPLLTDPYVAAYAYARNRPGMFVDPSGLASEKPPGFCNYNSTNPASCGWSPPPAPSGEGFSFPTINPCAAKAGTGAAEDILGALAIADAFVSELVTLGAYTPLGIGETGFGLYHIYEGQQKLGEALNCE